VQVRFGVLNAGNFGVSQSRKRTFIWAAAPGETLPAWPQPLTVFKSPQLCINLPGGISYKAVEDGKNARLRAVTVKDAIGDLPAVENGADTCAAPVANVQRRQAQLHVHERRNADHASVPGATCALCIGICCVPGMCSSCSLMPPLSRACMCTSQPHQRHAKALSVLQARAGVWRRRSVRLPEGHSRRTDSVAGPHL
jgi:hypothetical protein